MLFASWHQMLEALEGMHDVSGHGHIADAIGIIPIKDKATVFGTCPILADDVRFVESVKEVLGISIVDVFDTKIVNNQC